MNKNPFVYSFTNQGKIGPKGNAVLNVPSARGNLCFKIIVSIVDFYIVIVSFELSKLMVKMFDPYVYIGDTKTQTTLNSSNSQYNPNSRSTKTTIQDEINWGKEYRNIQSQKAKPPLTPKQIPNEAVKTRECRKQELMRSFQEKTNNLRRRRVRPYTDNYFCGGLKKATQKDKSTNSRKSSRKKSSVFGISLQCREEERSKTSPSLLDRNTMSQKEYMDLLSSPNIIAEPGGKSKKKRCKIEACSPRIMQMSIPAKRLVLDTWRRYGDTLSTDKVEHFAKLLHTNQNVEPKIARCYFNKLEHEKKKIREQKQQKLKKSEEKCARRWINKMINNLSAAIVTYIQREPVFNLSYDEMLLSDSILDDLNDQEVLIKPPRNTNGVEDQTILAITDKIAFWADTILKCVDANVGKLDSTENIYFDDPYRY